MNIINAIYNLVNNPVVELVSYYQGKNRANMVKHFHKNVSNVVFDNKLRIREMV